MNKKTGTQCELKSPEPPLEAQEAVNADPGEAVELTTTQREVSTAELSQATDIDANREHEYEEAETHWIEVVLKDANGTPVPDESYCVKLPDGTTQRGRLNGEGKVRIEGIPEGGECQISFPDIDANEWRRV